LDNYLIDTSILIACLRGYKDEVTRIEKLLEQGCNLGCCSIIVTEIYAGLREKEKTKTETFINSLKFYPITRDIAKLAGKYIQNYSKRGITLSIADATIGAVTNAYKLKLLTYNKKHYPMVFK
jgi:predicted nucleic acid-binding protein